MPTNSTAAPHGGFTDGNGRYVSPGDRVEYRFGPLRGWLVTAHHDGEAWVRFDGVEGDKLVKWVHLAKVPEREPDLVPEAGADDVRPGLQLAIDCLDDLVKGHDAKRRASHAAAVAEAADVLRGRLADAQAGRAEEPAEDPSGSSALRDLMLVVRDLADRFDEHVHCLDRDKTRGPRGYRSGVFAERIDKLLAALPAPPHPVAREAGRGE